MDVPSRPVALTAERRRLLCVSFLLVCILAGGPPAVARAYSQGAGRHYAETGHTLAPEFVQYFDAHGGVAVFGFPVADARFENGRLVQWTERERLEWHPENAGTAYSVMLGLLGHELTAGLQGSRFRAGSGASASYASGDANARTGRFFSQTGHLVTPPFLDYWTEHGGVALFGYPISGQFRDESGLQVQWFERARFEWHPEMPPEFRVTLGRLGVESLKKAGWARYEVALANEPVADAPFHLDFAQGGESEDPRFLDNVREAGAALGGGLIRLDNIFTSYHVVSRTPEGRPHYSWSELDKALDSVRAMGREPFIALSYMPEVLSTSGSSRIEPPAQFGEWADLVRATVRHVNVERGLGVRYWEVWNEPNQWGFWRGSFQDYLRLYDATSIAATSVDSSIKVGGAAFSSFEPHGMAEFVGHVASAPAGVRLDFLSWHSYGRTPDQLESEVDQARSLLAPYPSLAPELIITEFNVLQGGPGDTSVGNASDTVTGAITLLRSVEALMRARLDRAFLFELKDGPGPAALWGRWGMLTYNARPKPIYYAARAFANRPSGQVPARLVQGTADGSLGAMAFGGSARLSILIWYTGEARATVKVDVPERSLRSVFDAIVLDEGGDRAAQNGDDVRGILAPREGGDLVFSLRPNSVLLVESR